jgi:hypothetical protein
MNKITLLYILCFVCSISFAQNDSTAVPQPPPEQQQQSPQNQSRNQPADRNPRHRPPHQKPGMIPEDFWKKVYWGGNLALSFGSYSSYYEISPNAGYKINNILSVGPQIIYQSYTYHYSNANTTFNIYGGGAFARALIIPQIFLQAEYDILSVPNSYSILNQARTPSDEKLVGIGLRNSYGGSFSYYLTILFDVNPTPQSPYYNPGGVSLVPRAGFNVNF